MYTTSNTLLDTPIDHYICSDMLPLYRHYENLCTLLSDNFNKLNLSPEEIHKVYRRLENSLAWVAYEHKEMAYTSGVSVDLVYNEFVSNRGVK